MPKFRAAVMTDAGASLMAAAFAEGFQMEFVKMLIGSGKYEENEKTVEALKKRTDLKSKRQEVGFSSAASAKENVIQLKALVTNENLDEGYHMTEIAVIAKKAGEGEPEILYSIAIADEADYLPPKESPIEIVQEFYTKVSNAEKVSINLNMSTVALAEDVEKIINPSFEEANTRENIKKKDNYFTILGKIKKFFADLKTIAFTGSYNDLENKPDIPAAVAVKGNAEKNYRTGNVNLTPDNIGALPISGGTLTGQLQVGEKVKIYTSSEGGNIQIISPDDIGLRWELDAFKGDLRFICFNNDGTVKKICQLTKDGAIIANNATQSEAGLMSPKDKKKLDNLSDAATIGGDTAENIASFSTASARQNLKSGEKHSILFGKIAKWFADLKTVAFSGNYNDLSNKPTIPTIVNNNTTTEAGYALDARQANPNVDGSLAKQISTLNSGLTNKSYIKIIKGDWSGLMGTLTPLFDTGDKVINLIAHNELDDTYPAVRVGRADADRDGNNIPTTYLKKSDAKTMFNTGYRQVSSNEFDKYFSDTWSYVGADGLSIDSGTWLVNYYCWVSESSAVDVISLKSTVDQAIGITAPNNGNGGTWLTMHEIISGKAVSNLKFLIKVPKAVTFGQINTKITAIKLC